MPSTFALFVPQWKDLIWEASLSMTNPDSEWPVTNLQDNDPANLAKATGLETDITITLSGAFTVVLAAVLNSNATIASISNGAGLNEPFVVPSRTVSGKQRNMWRDLTGVEDTEDDEFVIHLEKAGSDPVQAGRLVLGIELKEFTCSPNPEISVIRPGGVRVPTRLGSRGRRVSPVTPKRNFLATFEDLADRATVEDLEEYANGLDRGFLLIPDRTIAASRQDCQWMEPSEDGHRLTHQGGKMVLRLPLEEISQGAPPSPD